MTETTPLTTTRQSLHAVAELVLAGVQYDACGRIALRVSPGGFATRFEPDLRVEGTDLVGGFGRISMDRLTPHQLCAAAGLPVVSLAEVYTDGAVYGPDDVLSVDPTAAAVIADAWACGQEALRTVAPDVDPVLWPEHFDVGITVDEINLGVSPGDAFLDVPYAYVGPWTVPADDPFFDAPFGAARALTDLGGVTEVSAFFSEGLRRARS